MVLLNNTAPLFVPLIIWFWHKVKISGFLGLSLIVGFGGVVLVLRPGFETLRIGLILGAISGVFSALLLVVTRQIAGEPFIRILFYYYLLWWGLLLPFILFFWEATPLFLWLWLIGSALASIGAQWAFTAALRFAPSQEVAPFIYTSVIFSGIIGWVIWREAIELLSLIGMLVVCAGGILTMWAARRSV